MILLHTPNIIFLDFYIAIILAQLFISIFYYKANIMNIYTLNISNYNKYE